MENASKALIIAASILLAILIIALGMAVFRRANGDDTTAGWDEQKVSSYNAQFEKYEGKQKGSAIKSLLNEVRTHNGNESNDSEDTQIVVNGTAGVKTANAGSGSAYLALDEQSVSNNIKSTASYTVSFSRAKDGHITTITIDK